MNYRVLAALCCTLLLYFSACKKDDRVKSTPAMVPTTPSTSSDDRSKLNQLFSDFRSTPQSLSVAAGTYAVVTGANGTKLTFYPNSFKDASGHTITSGTINIQLIEMYKPGAMIANRATTAADDKPLISGGQVYIKATKGGQEVSARKYGIGFKATSSSSQRMSLYYGNTANVDSVVVWQKADSAVGTFAPVTTGDTTYDSTSGYHFENFYQFDSCISFGFINCDYPWGPGATLTDVKVTTPDTSYHWGNVQVYVVIPSITSVMNAYPNYAATSTSFLAHNIPIGTSVKVIAVAKKGTTYYYAEQTGITVTSYITVPVTFSVQTVAYIQAQLAGL